MNVFARANNLDSPEARGRVDRSMNTGAGEDGRIIAPFVSVIVPVFNDSTRLATCLKALECQTYPKHLYEVIVVDNGSAEPVAPLVRAYGQARACYEAQASSYAARNKGISVAKGEIIAFTDADCIPSCDWIERGAAALLSVPDRGIVAGHIEVFAADSKRPTMVELYDCTRGYRQRKYVEVDGYGATANLFTFKTVLDDVGAFDPALKSYGDVEWGRRVSQSGYQLLYSEDTRVIHPARTTFGQLLGKIARGRGGLYELQIRRKDLEQDHPKWGWVPATLMSVWRDERLSTATERIKVITVLCVIQCVKGFENVRLMLGGKPRR